MGISIGVGVVVIVVLIICLVVYRRQKKQIDEYKEIYFSRQSDYQVFFNEICTLPYSTGSVESIVLFSHDYFTT